MCSAIGVASAFPFVIAGSIAFAVRIPEAGAVFVDVTAPPGVVHIIRSRSSAGHGGNDAANDDEDHDGDADAETAADTTTAADGPGSSVTG